jgi:heat-inducible transcriptional repressor
VLREIISDFGEIGRVLVELVLQGLAEEKEEQIYATGASNILTKPEFRDVQRAAALLEALEEKDVLMNVMSSTAKSSGVQVVIGQENVYAPMQTCSIVTCTYYVGSDVVGALGVLGPTRMDYSKMVAAVDLVARTVSLLLTKHDR